MFKKISLALFITCISASSYAYVVGANLTVENKTDVPMVIEVAPNGQGEKYSNKFLHMKPFMLTWKMVITLAGYIKRLPRLSPSNLNGKFMHKDVSLITLAHPLATNIAF